MAKVHGTPGAGAINKAQRSALKRLHPDEKRVKLSNQSDMMSFLKFVWIHVLCGFIMWIGIFMFGFGNSPITGKAIMFGAFALYCYMMYQDLVVNSDSRKTKEFLADSDKYIASFEKVFAQVRSDVEALVDGKTIGSSILNDDEMPWVIGAAGEIKTSNLLDAHFDDSYAIVNDLSIRQDGVEKANIDHLFLSNNGVIMIDSKIWAQPIRVQSTGGATFIPQGAPYWDKVSTCVWEGAQLPCEVRAIVFAVGGKTGSELKNNAVSVTHFIEKYGDGKLVQLPIPVLFVNQDQIGTYIQRLDETLPVNQFVTPEQLQGASDTSLSF